jgi:hypothetical protein
MLSPRTKERTMTIIGQYTQHRNNKTLTLKQAVYGVRWEDDQFQVQIMRFGQLTWITAEPKQYKKC